jgi:hypothetical protein
MTRHMMARIALVALAGIASPLGAQTVVPCPDTTALSVCYLIELPVRVDTLHTTDTVTVTDTLTITDTVRFTDTLRVVDTLPCDCDTIQPPDTIPADSVPRFVSIVEDTAGQGSTVTVRIRGLMATHETLIDGAQPRFVAGVQVIYEQPTRADGILDDSVFAFRVDPGQVRVRVWGIPGYRGPADTTLTTAPDAPQPPDTTPPPPPPPPPLPQPGDPELPRDTVPLAVPLPTRTVLVPAGGDLQAAINAAQRGDRLALAPGATFRGEYRLPVKPGTGWVTITTNVALPLGRMTPAQAGSLRLARIVSGQGWEPALRTDPGASHYRVQGVELTFEDRALQFGSGGIVRLGSGQQTVANTPAWIMLDRVWIHGYAHQITKRCVELNTAWSAVIDSYLDDCHSNTQDSQAIMGWNGPGPYRIENNYLAGGAEIVMFGGADPSIPDLVPSDITIRRNHFHRPTSWKSRPTVMVKNSFELKNARRVLAEGNVFEGNWTDGQVGYSLNLKSANQSGSCTWCVTEHVTIRYNEILNSTSGITILATSSNPDVPLNNLLIEHNLLHKLGPDSDFGGWGVGFQTVSGPYRVTIRNNTIISNRQPLIFSSGTNANFTFAGNVTLRGQYGIKGNGTPEGTASITQYAPGGVVTGNVLIGARASLYPTGNHFPATVADVGFANYPGGDYRITGQYAGAGANLVRLAQLTSGVR